MALATAATVTATTPTPTPTPATATASAATTASLSQPSWESYYTRRAPQPPAKGPKGFSARRFFRHEILFVNNVPHKTYYTHTYVLCSQC